MGTMTPKLSVVMCAFNEQEYIRESVESVLSSTWEDFELIIINDASTDRTLAIVEKLAEADPRIKIHSNINNLGIAESSNLGFSLVQGEFTAIMDADDVAMRERFELQISLLEGHPEIGLVGASMYIFSGLNKGEVRHAHTTKVQEILIKENTIHNPTVMFRSALLQKGKFKCKKKYRYAHDYEFWSRLSVETEFANIDRPLLIYRDNKNSSNSNSSKAPFRRELEVITVRFIHMIRLIRRNSFDRVQLRYFLASILKSTIPALLRIMRFEFRKFFSSQ